MTTEEITAKVMSIINGAAESGSYEAANDYVAKIAHEEGPLNPDDVTAIRERTSNLFEHAIAMVETGKMLANMQGKVFIVPDGVVLAAVFGYLVAGHYTTTDERQCALAARYIITESIGTPEQRDDMQESVKAMLAVGTTIKEMAESLDAIEREQANRAPTGSRN